MARIADPELAGKTERIEARVSPATRRRLQAAADAAGVKLSREIERRLAASLDNDDILAEFDGAETYTLCRVIAAAMYGIRRELGAPWYANPLAWLQACKAIAETMRCWAPDGDPVATDNHPMILAMRRFGSTEEQISIVKKQIEDFPTGRMVAQELISRIERGDPDPDDRFKVNQLQDIRGIAVKLIAAAGNTGDAEADHNRFLQRYRLGFGPDADPRPWDEILQEERN